ncbi:unnamed protein product [Lathyrus sativus]|nr:unnamed protein product [Lathyrus sativus]
MGSERRGTLPLKFKIPSVASLIALGSKLTHMNEKDVIKSYGKIMNLLTVEANTRALVSLAQFYDPSLRCFTFQDFQLAPTIEEFERILGRHLKDFKPFTDLRETPSPDMIAVALSLLIRDVAICLMIKGATHGLSRKPLKIKAWDLEKEKNRRAFNVVLALQIME